MGSIPWVIFQVKSYQWLTKWYFSAASGSQNGTSVRPVAHKMVLQCGQWLTKWYFSAASGSQNGTSVRPVAHKMVLQCGRPRFESVVHFPGQVTPVAHKLVLQSDRPRFDSRLRHAYFSTVELYQRLKQWYFSVYPARRLAAVDWLVRCQYTVTG